MLDFDELNELLTNAHTGSRASECHGFLCGYLCVSNTIDEDVFRRLLLADTGQDDLSGECYMRITELAGDINSQITSPNFELQLMLPDDETPLVDRSVALTQWCQGFLSGLGAAGSIDFDYMSAECREFVDDVYKICRLDTSNIEKEGEEEESALFELIEYVRAGVILLHDELQGDIAGIKDNKVLH